MTTNSIKCDVAIFGGGVAGLWLLAELRQQGFQTILFETDTLGAGQTRYAQGIIHGGTKYALMGKITASSEAISAMPIIWRDCIEGHGRLNLSSIKVLSKNQCMWSSNALSSKMAGFFASKMMRSRTTEIKKNQQPELFQNKLFKGNIYLLDEPVLDTASIVNALAKPHIEAIVPVKKLPDYSTTSNTNFNIEDRDGNQWQVITQYTVLTAGQGNETLLKALPERSDQLKSPTMQRRPLKMVMLRGNLPEKIYAHCLEANVNPRITITSHEDKNNNIVWYMGGQLAEEGVNRTNQEQVEYAKKELSALLPWLDLSHSEWACLDIDRAEPLIDKGKRPDSSFFVEQDNIITAWPTKLALAPKLSDDIINTIKNKIAPSGLDVLPKFAEINFALLPWQDENNWQQEESNER